MTFTKKTIEILLNFSFSTLKCYSFNDFFYFIQNSYLDSCFFLDDQNLVILFKKMFYEFNHRVQQLRDNLQNFQNNYFTRFGQSKSMIKHFYLEDNINQMNIIYLLNEIEELSVKDINDYLEEIQNDKKQFYLSFTSPFYGLI